MIANNDSRTLGERCLQAMKEEQALFRLIHGDLSTFEKAWIESSFNLEEKYTIYVSPTSLAWHFLSDNSCFTYGLTYREQWEDLPLKLSLLRVLAYFGRAECLNFCLAQLSEQRDKWLHYTDDRYGLNLLHLVCLGAHLAVANAFTPDEEGQNVQPWVDTMEVIFNWLNIPVESADDLTSKTHFEALLQKNTLKQLSALHLCVGKMSPELLCFLLQEAGTPTNVISDFPSVPYKHPKTFGAKAIHQLKSSSENIRRGRSGSQRQSWKNNNGKFNPAQLANGYWEMLHAASQIQELTCSTREDTLRLSDRPSLKTTAGVLIKAKPLLEFSDYPLLKKPSERRFKLSIATALGYWARLAYLDTNPNESPKLDYEVGKSKNNDLKTNLFLQLFSRRWHYEKVYAIEKEEFRVVVALRKKCLNSDERPHLIVSFRGTKTADNWKADLDIPHKNNSHSGFYKAVDTIWRELFEIIKRHHGEVSHIFLTGHSLGAAMAMMTLRRLADLEADLKGIIDKLILYNFASPRVGAECFREVLDNSLLFSRMYCLVQQGDIVPTVPPVSFNFRHAGNLRFFDGKGKLHNDTYYIIEDLTLHFMREYKTSKHTLKADLALVISYCQSVFEVLLEAMPETTELPDFEGSTFKSNNRLILNFTGNFLEKHSMDGYLKLVTDAYKAKAETGKQGKFIPICGKEKKLRVSSDWFSPAKKLIYEQIKLDALYSAVCKYLQYSTHDQIELKPHDTTTTSSPLVWSWLEQEQKILTTLQNHYEVVQFLLAPYAITSRESKLRELHLTNSWLEAKYWRAHKVSPAIYWSFLRIVALVEALKEPEQIQEELERCIARLPAFCYTLELKLIENQEYFPVIQSVQGTRCRYINLLRDLMIHSHELFGSIIYSELMREKLLNIIESTFDARGIHPQFDSARYSWRKWLFREKRHSEPFLSDKKSPHQLTLLIDNALCRGVPTSVLVNKILTAADNQSIQMINCSIKAYPKFPGLERANYLLAMLLVGKGVLPNCLAKLVVFTKGEPPIKTTTPLLISAHTLTSARKKPKSFKEICDKPKELERINHESYSRHFIIELVALGTNTHPGQFIITTEVQEDRKKEWLLWRHDGEGSLSLGIDEEHCIKSIIFCMNQMNRPIHPQVMQELSKMNFDLVLKTWFKILEEESFSITPCTNIKKETLYETGEHQFFMGKDPRNIQRILFRPNTIRQLYARLRKIQDTLKQAGLTHKQLLEVMFPQVAKIYQQVLQEQITPKLRFEKVSPKLGSLTEDYMNLHSYCCSPTEHLEEAALWIEEEKSQRSSTFNVLVEYLISKNSLNLFKNDFNQLSGRMQALFVNEKFRVFYNEYPESSDKRSSTKEQIEKAVISCLLKTKESFDCINLSGYQYLTGKDLYEIISHHQVTLKKLVLQDLNKHNILQPWLLKERGNKDDMRLPNLSLVDVTGAEVHEGYFNACLWGKRTIVKGCCSMGSDIPPIKITIIGDLEQEFWRENKAINGNLAFIEAYINKAPVLSARTLVSDQIIRQKNILVDTQPVTLLLMHNQGWRENFEKSEQAQKDALFLESTDIYILRLPIFSRESFERAREFLIPSVLKAHVQNKPFILVGDRIEMRDVVQQNLETISTKDGEAYALELGAMAYFECSWVTKQGLYEVFEKTAQMSLSPPKPKKKGSLTQLFRGSSRTGRNSSEFNPGANAGSSPNSP